MTTAMRCAPQFQCTGMPWRGHRNAACSWCVASTSCIIHTYMRMHIWPCSAPLHSTVPSTVVPCDCLLLPLPLLLEHPPSFGAVRSSCVVLVRWNGAGRAAVHPLACPPLHRDPCPEQRCHAAAELHQPSHCWSACCSTGVHAVCGADATAWSVINKELRCMDEVVHGRPLSCARVSIASCYSTACQALTRATSHRAFDN